MWHFQATRHDLWDSDFAAPPILLTVNRNGRRVDAVAATNKFGFIYIFDRVTGESLFPMTEMTVTEEHGRRRNHVADAADSHAAGAVFEADDDAR